MPERLILKILGELFYLVTAFCVLYGIRGFFRRKSRMNLTVIKTHITAYQLQKLIEGRSR